MARKRKTIPDTYDIEEIVCTGDIEKLEELFNKCEKTAFQQMLYYKEISKETLEWLLDKGIDINETDQYSSNPPLLEQAIQGGNIMMFIEHGADKDITGRMGKNMLHLASRYLQPQSVKTALALGIDMYTTTVGDTALYLAVQYCSDTGFPKLEKIVRLFLENGYTVNEQERNALIRNAKKYEFEKDSYTYSSYTEHIDEIETALDNLYKLMDIKPVPRITKHDGVSPISIPTGTVEEQFEILYNTLTPSHGKAKSMQGEAIRIVGCINSGISYGRENLNANEKLMLKSLMEFLSNGNAVSEENLEAVKRIRLSKINQDKLIDLAGIVILWIEQNPNPFPLPETPYKK